jgi:hypothetical protein
VSGPAISRPNAFPAYLLGLASWFVPLGIQMVLFPWLVAVVLHMDAFAVGVAQAAIMAPSLFCSCRWAGWSPIAAIRAGFCCSITPSTPCRRWRWPWC